MTWPTPPAGSTRSVLGAELPVPIAPVGERHRPKGRLLDQTAMLSWDDMAIRRAPTPPAGPPNTTESTIVDTPWPDGRDRFFALNHRSHVRAIFRLQDGWSQDDLPCHDVRSQDVRGVQASCDICPAKQQP